MYADAFVATLLCGAFALVFYGPWQSICVDVARMIIFEKRDEIFDLAVDGKVDIESDEYREIRAVLQGLIRFAHMATLPYFVFDLASRGRVEYGVDINSLVAKVEDIKVRKDIRRKLDKSYEAIVASMALRSLVFMVPFIIFAIPYSIFAGVRRALSKQKERLYSIVQSEAVNSGC